MSYRATIRRPVEFVLDGDVNRVEVLEPGTRLTVHENPRKLRGHRVKAVAKQAEYVSGKLKRYADGADERCSYAGFVFVVWRGKLRSVRPSVFEGVG